MRIFAGTTPRDVILVSIIQNVISVDERASGLPDSFFVVNKLGRRTTRGQRAHIVVATDRGIDLTLERNACLLAGCHFALRINRDGRPTKLV